MSARTANDLYEQAHALRDELMGKLQDVVARYAQGGAATDSPFQLVTDHGGPDIARLKTDTFRERLEYAVERKRELARVRGS